MAQKKTIRAAHRSRRRIAGRACGN